MVSSIGCEPGLDLNLETFRVVSAPRYERAALVEEGALLGIVNGEAASLAAIAHVLRDQVISTFRPAGFELAPMECDATDLGLDTRSDGHLLLHGTGYARRKRAEGAPRWARGYADSTVYAWLLAEPYAFETSTWLFTHRTGVEALGDQPLEHFHEWDNEDGGDCSLETPLGETGQDPSCVKQPQAH